MEKQNPIKSTRWWQLATQPHILFPLIAVVVLAAIWGTTLTEIRAERAAAQRVAATSVHDLVELYEAQVLRALGEMDLTLKLVKYAYERGGKPSVLRELNARSLLPPALLFVVSIADSKGDVVDSTARAGMPNITGQNLAQGRIETNAIEVNRPQQDPATGEWTLVFSRRLDAADGSYAGIVMISVSAAYFVSGYEASKLGQHGLLAMVGTDGIFRARRSGDKVSAGGITDFQALPMHADDEAKPASRLETDAWDGVRRYTSVRRLYGFPLAVIVGLSADEQMAPFRQAARDDLWRTARISVLAILILGVMTRMGWQLARTRRSVARELEEKVRERTQQLLETQQELEQHRAHLEREVAQRTASLTAAQRIGHLGDWEWDVINSTVSWSDEMYRIFGYAPQQIASSYEAFLNAVHPEDRQLVNDTVSEALAEQHTYDIEHRILRPDGTLRYVHGRAEVMQGDDGKPISMAGTLQDVTERKQAEQTATDEKNFSNTLIASQPAIFYVLDSTGRFIRWNDKLRDVLGLSDSQLAATDALDIVHEPDRPLVAQKTREAFEQGTATNVARLITKTGIRDFNLTASRVDTAKGAYAIGVGTDITERKLAEAELQSLHEQLREQALRDPLTGLYNRRYLEETIERELVRAARNNRPVAIVMCDLDHFKLVNDTHGHLAGDEVLRVFAALLKTHARGSDVVCRFGGEEFVMFLPDMPPAVAYQRAEKLRTELAAKRITVGAAVIQVTASFGVAAFPENGKTMDSLINAVDAAMYQAKEAGRNRIVVSSAHSADGQQVPRAGRAR